MTETTCSHESCKNPVHCKGLCQPHYRQAARAERGLKKPGPKPDPSKPFSRHNGELTHHGKRAKCKNGHEFDGVSDAGRQTCSQCVRTHCSKGHEYTEENTYYWGSERRCRRCNADRQKIVWPKIKYGITPSIWQEMLDKQNNQCAICKHLLADTGPYRAEMDHDHSCCPGQITCGKCLRKILCQNCNRLLGAAKDSISILQAAINYLKTNT